MKTQELEDMIRGYLRERGWDKLRPSDLAKSIVIEGAELLELFQWDNPELKIVKQDKKKLGVISGELADVLIYCFDLAVLLDLDVSKIIIDKLNRVKKKYPAKLMKSNAKSGAGSGEDSEYWRIKKEYRRKGE